VEDGKLHIHRDVYDQDTNTEENLQAVLEANGSSLEKLSAQERAEVMSALSAMSAHPKKISAPISNDNSANSNSDEGQTAKKKKKTEADKKTAKNQKEVIIEISSLTGRGYPAPVDLDTGSGKPAPAVAVKSSKIQPTKN
jgi:hypothetical protein